MYIVPEPIEVKAIEKYKLYIKFKNGEEKILDMGQIGRASCRERV